jgi:hypothetical protein
MFERKKRDRHDTSQDAPADVSVAGAEEPAPTTVSTIDDEARPAEDERPATPEQPDEPPSPAGEDPAWPEDDGVGILGVRRDPDREARAQRDELGEQAARDTFGGMNPGAAFFGWLVALSCTALVSGFIGAVVAGVSGALDVDQSAAERAAGTIGVVAACVFLVVAAIGWYAGGYVAGRMSRFDGGRQGLGVWLIGLLAMVAAVAVGAVFGTQYNVLDRANLPQLPVSGSDASTGALVAGGAFLLVTLVAAVAGGKVGRRYHRKVDRAHLAD